MVLDYRRNYLTANNYQTSPHWSQLDGVALHFWMTGDDSSRIAVGKAAWNLAPSAQWPRTGPYTDARQQARALVSTIPQREVNAILLRAARNTGFRGRVTLSAFREGDLEAFTRAGAASVLQPYIDAADSAARRLLEEVGQPLN